jgi:Uma2 family endonuclease
LEPVSRPKVRFTRRDLEQLPEDWRAELLEGDLVMVPAPDPSHQGIVGDLHVALRAHLGAAGRDRVLMAPTDVVVDDESVLQPDLLVLPEGTERKPRPWRIPAPAWVAEVLSPGTAARDRGIKLRLYARLGVEEAWLVDPDAGTVVVHDLAAGRHRRFVRGERAVSEALPGFAVDVTGLFAV